MKILLLLVLILIVAAGGYFLITQGALLPKTPLIFPTPMAGNNVSPTTVIDNNDLMAGGASYRDPQGIFSFLYPNEYTLDTQDPKHIRIYKHGPTQKGQTEIYDGVLLVFEGVNLSGKTLSQFVDQRINEATADGTSEITGAKTAIIINGHPGFTYSSRGLGESKNYILQKDANADSAVVISTLVADPQKLGLQTEVDKTLSTLQLLK